MPPYLIPIWQLINVIITVKLAPLNIKKGHYPNLQRFPDARERTWGI
jgi:hypothetical protein